MGGGGSPCCGGEAHVSPPVFVETRLTRGLDGAPVPETCGERLCWWGHYTKRRNFTVQARCFMDVQKQLPRR